MNFFPFEKSIWNKSKYILGWTVFSLFYEFLSVLSGYFYHNGWNYWLSAFTYPFLLLLQLLHLKIFRLYNK